MSGTQRISFGFKMMMWMLGFQIITLGFVLSLWSMEMGRSTEYASNHVQAMAVFGAAAIVSPYVYEGYYELKDWYRTRGETA